MQWHLARFLLPLSIIQIWIVYSILLNFYPKVLTWKTVKPLRTITSTTRIQEQSIILSFYCHKPRFQIYKIPSFAIPFKAVTDHARIPKTLRTKRPLLYTTKSLESYELYLLSPFWTNYCVKKQGMQESSTKVKEFCITLRHFSSELANQNQPHKRMHLKLRNAPFYARHVLHFRHGTCKNLLKHTTQLTAQQIKKQ